MSPSSEAMHLTGLPAHQGQLDWRGLPGVPSRIVPLSIRGEPCAAFFRDGFGQMLLKGPGIEGGAALVEFSPRGGGEHATAAAAVRATLSAGDGFPRNVIVVAYRGGPTAGGVQIVSLQPFRSMASVPLPFAPTSLLSTGSAVVITGDPCPRLLFTAEGAIAPLAPPQHKSTLQSPIRSAVSLQQGSFLTLDTEGVLRQWTLPDCFTPTPDGGSILSKSCSVVALPPGVLPLGIFPSALRLQGTGGDTSASPESAWVVHEQPASSSLALTLLRIRPFGSDEAAGGGGGGGGGGGATPSSSPCTKASAFCKAVPHGARLGDIAMASSCNADLDILSVSQPGTPAGGISLSAFAEGPPEGPLGHAAVREVPISLPETGLGFSAQPPADRQLLGVVACPVRTSATAAALRFFSAAEVVDVDVLPPAGAALRRLAALPKPLGADRGAAIAAIAGCDPTYAAAERLPEGFADSTAQTNHIMDYLLEVQGMQIASQWVQRSSAASNDDIGPLRAVLLWLAGKMHASREGLSTALAKLNRGEWSLAAEAELERVRRQVLQLTALCLALGSVRPEGSTEVQSLQCRQEHHTRMIETENLQDQLDAVVFLRGVLFRRAANPLGDVSFKQNLAAHAGFKRFAKRAAEERRASAAGLSVASIGAFSNTLFVIETLVMQLSVQQKQQGGEGAGAAPHPSSAGTDILLPLRSGLEKIKAAVASGVKPPPLPQSLAEKLKLVGELPDSWRPDGEEDAAGRGGGAASPTAASSANLSLAFDVLYAHAMLSAEAAGGAAFLEGGLQLLDVAGLFGEQKPPRITEGCKVDLLAPFGAGWTTAVVSAVNPDSTIDITTGDGKTHTDVSEFLAVRQGAAVVVQPCALKLLRQSVLFLYLLGGCGSGTAAGTADARRYARCVAKLPPRWVSFLESAHAASSGNAQLVARSPLAPLSDTDVSVLVASLLVVPEGGAGSTSGAAEEEEGGRDVRGRREVEGAESALRGCVDDVTFAAFRAMWRSMGASPTLPDVIAAGLAVQPHDPMGPRAPTAPSLNRHHHHATLDVANTSSASAASAQTQQTTPLRPAQQGTAERGCYAKSGISFASLVHARSLVLRGDVGAALDTGRSLGLAGEGGAAFAAAVMCFALESGADWRPIVTRPMDDVHQLALIALLTAVRSLQSRDRSMLKGAAAHADTLKPLAALLHASNRHEELLKQCILAEEAMGGAAATAPLLASLQASAPTHLTAAARAAARSSTGDAPCAAVAEAAVPTRPLRHLREPEADGGCYPQHTESTLSGRWA